MKAIVIPDPELCLEDTEAMYHTMIPLEWKTLVTPRIPPAPYTMGKGTSPDERTVVTKLLCTMCHEIFEVTF